MTGTVSVLVVSYNTRDLLRQAIASVVDEPDVDVIVVDNASRDGSADTVADEFPTACLVRSARNLGFAGGTNLAARHAHGDALLLLNPDAALQPGALDRMREMLAETPRAAAVGPRLQYPNGVPQASAFRFAGLAQLWLDLFPVNRLADTRVNGRVWCDQPHQIDHPLGACMLVRRTAWDDVGPLDEGYFMYLEEVDWCQRACARGWQIWYEPRALAIHHAGAATRQQPNAMFAQLWRSRLRYYQRFHGPGYNRLVRLIVRLGLRAAARRSETGSTLASVRALTR